ncbi:hypothetical protein KUTeg_006968 [Tegillarca granosa]|uniref:Protein jagunal n=1 Tax=Tegillarca granosa TaxID=220873 RepID=A0ABQ9FGK7_TEGGR|nr:hypothetical protein KUTeg_006968 [Tegillarca granosa]
MDLVLLKDCVIGIYHAPRPWEYAWMISLAAVVFGWKSLPKSESLMLRQYVIGTVVFGVIPIIYGVIDQMDDLYNYLNEKKSTGQILGYPAVLVWFLFLLTSAQLHGFGLYFASQLLSAWKTKIDKRFK